MTPDIAIQWVAYAVQQPVEQVLALGLDHDQLVTLAGWIAERPLINPTVSRPIKGTEFTCACCGKTFWREYRTSRPKYCSPACKQKAYRQRKRERALAALEAKRSAPAGLVRKANGGFSVVRGSAA